MQFLTALEQERLIGLDREGRWTWDLARIRARGFTDNVVEFMISRLARLPAPEQRALARLACVGSACDATTLAWVLGSEDGAAPSDPWEALREGLIVRVGDG